MRHTKPVAKLSRTKAANKLSGRVEAQSIRATSLSVWPTIATWSGPVLIAAAALAMLGWTWGTWPDVLIDSGDQCYIPWRLTQGDVLYRDIAFYNGPLSQYFNAACFAVFGTSLRTLFFCNLAILALLIALLYYAICAISCRFAAAIACLLFVLLFAFAQYVPCANYNYVYPYSHEMTHGLLLCLSAIVLAWPSSRHILPRTIASGMALGLAFLTKAEVFLPGAAATLVAVVFGLWFERLDGRRKAARLTCFAVAALAAPILALGCLALAMPANEAFSSVLGSWAVAVRSDIASLRFFREGIGLDQPMANVWDMLMMSGFYAAILLPAGFVGWMVRQPGKYETVFAVEVFALIAGALWCWRGVIYWGEIARPFPLLLSLTIVAIVINFIPRRGDPEAQRRFIRQISLLVFALALLAKMILNTRIPQYGFVLAMPATLLLSVAACDWIPNFIERRGGNGGFFTAAALAVLFIAGAVYHGYQAKWMGIKTHSVGVGADRFLSDARGLFVNAAMEAIARKVPPGKTVAVLPEGCTLNFLGRWRNPTPYIHLMPVEVMFFGEDQILKAFKTHSPDVIVLVHKNTSEFGFHFFGTDYARQLGTWIAENYHQSSVIGALPFRDDRFGIAILIINKGPDGL